MPNDLLVTTTDILGIEVAKDYSGASGIYVDNVNNIISITGDVGKEYNGIEPIVVNNEENLISANSAPIGVQEPLYFVQDDDEAVIIGFSGEYVTPSDIAGKLDTSSFESWQQGQYTNDLTAINQKITEVSSNIPSLEGYATEQFVEETSAAIVSQIPSTAGLASETYVQEQTSAKASKSDLETVSGDIVNLIPDVSNFYTKDETSGAEQLAEAFANIPGGEGDAEVNALVHSNSATWNEVSSKLDESTFQEASGLFLTAIPQEYITETDIPNFISAKLDTSSFANVSGSFLTAHQSLEGYATEQFVEDTSASITALIPTDYYPNSNPSGFISGVDLSNYYQKNETSSKEEISAAIAAIPLGDEEVNQAVHTNSATWNTVTDKLDTTSFSDVSSTFLTAVDLSPYQTTAGMTAYQPVGDYATTAQLADKIDNSAITLKSIPGFGNIVSGISGYKLYSYTAENSQWANVAGKAYKDNNGNDITATYLTTAATANFATTGDLALKQDTLTFGYDEQDRINSINNSALAGGGDVPEDVMVETNLEFNAVNEISGYNGSAIAQYGAEKQWLVHDDTIVSISNSAQYALGVNISALQRLMGIDETLLFSGDLTTNIELSSPISSFNKLRIMYSCNSLTQSAWNNVPQYIDLDSNNINNILNLSVISKNGKSTTNSMLIIETEFSANADLTKLVKVNSYQVHNSNGTWSTGNNNSIHIYKVYGIGRKS